MWSGRTTVEQQQSASQRRLRTNPPSLEVFAMHDLCRVVTDAIQ